MLSVVFNHLLCFYSMGGTKKVNELINRPVVSLLGTRVSSTITEEFLGVVVYFQQNKKKAEAEGKNCHATTV